MRVNRQTDNILITILHTTPAGEAVNSIEDGVRPTAIPRPHSLDSVSAAGLGCVTLHASPR